MNDRQFITRNAQRLRDAFDCRNPHFTGPQAPDRHRDVPPSTSAQRQADRHNYDALAFPGGLATARSRILLGQPDAIDAALTFLEVRPYFFRSGYVRDDLFRWLKRLYREKPTALTDTHLNRLIATLEIRHHHRSLRTGRPAHHPTR